MAAKDAKTLFKELNENRFLSKDVRAEENVEVMKEFLKEFPKSIPADKNPKSTIMDLSVREVLSRTVGTAVDIVEDISKLVSERHQMSSTQLRRSVLLLFTEPSRRLFVGIWLVVISFILYFIDSAA